MEHAHGAPYFIDRKERVVIPVFDVKDCNGDGQLDDRLTEKIQEKRYTFDKLTVNHHPQGASIGTCETDHIYVQLSLSSIRLFRVVVSQHQ